MEYHFAFLLTFKINWFVICIFVEWEAFSLNVQDNKWNLNLNLKWIFYQVRSIVPNVITTHYSNDITMRNLFRNLTIYIYVCIMKKIWIHISLKNSKRGKHNPLIQWCIFIYSSFFQLSEEECQLNSRMPQYKNFQYFHPVRILNELSFILYI